MTIIPLTEYHVCSIFMHKFGSFLYIDYIIASSKADLVLLLEGLVFIDNFI